MKRRNRFGTFGRTMLIASSLLLSVVSLAQEGEREVPVEDDDRAEYAVLEEVIVRGHLGKWRLTDEDLEKMWREEVEGDPPPPEGAVAEFGGPRFKTELLPLYDPEDPLLIELGEDPERMEAVELIRIRF